MVDFNVREYWKFCFPEGFWAEWIALSKLAFPIMFTSLVEYLTAPISLFFCGMLGKTELAAAGLAISVFHTAGVSFIMGLLTAGETLFSQTYGGANKFRLGIQAQRAFLILSLCCLPCWSVHLVIEQILLATKQPPLVAKYAGEYIIGLMPGLFFFSLFEIFTKYVQTQNKVLPPMIAGIIGNIVNALVHYIFIYHTNFGLVGSAFAQSICFFTQASCVLLYIIFSGIHRHTWDGLRVEMWHDWGIWFRLGVPGAVMFGLEWWVCEAGSLTAGLRGEEALAVQTILNNLESIIFCFFPLGYGIAVAIRIGQFLGANNCEGPKATALVGIITLLVVAIGNAVILLGGRYVIPRIFTNDPSIIAATAYGMPSMVVYQFFDCLVGVCSGVIRGVGMQKFGAIVCCVCMYLVGGPVALYLLLKTDLAVPGFWWGLSIGVALETLAYFAQCSRIDWKKMCLDAAKRTEIKFVKSKGAKDNQETGASLDDLAIAEGEETRTMDYNPGADENVEIFSADVRACSALILSTRALMILVSVGMLTAALCCRYLIDWQSIFQNYCLLSNGTLIAVTKVDRMNPSTAMAADCVRFIP